MNRMRHEIPTAYAVELLSLGFDMQDAGVGHIPCRVPCIETDGMLIPTMEGERGKYPMHPFVISIESNEETGGGVVSLAPVPTDENTDPRIGLPIFKPDEMEPEELGEAVGARTGYAALRSTYGVETITAEPGGRDRYIGVAAMTGALSDGNEQGLPSEAKATSFYMGLLRNVAAAKLPKVIALQKIQAAAPPTLPATLTLAV